MTSTLTGKYSAEQLARAEKIKLILMDVDGVMTDGTIYYFPDAQGNMTEFKGFDSRDGLGLHLCNFAGIATGVISGRNSPAVTERARLLKMRYVEQGHLDKIACWQNILKDAGIEANQAAFIGDDFPDVPLMRRAGLAVAVANARPEVKAVAHYVCESAGGAGAVREAIELILKAQGKWQESAARFEVAVD
jgi:3-deoxy-D-manno-octulosonate 8-phosphate phosphatase (KDO 8-P phosphatase)